MSPPTLFDVPILAIVGLSLSVMAGAVSMRITDALLPRLASEFNSRGARIVLLTFFCEGLTLLGAFPFIAANLHLHLSVSLAASGALLMLFAAGGMVFALAVRRIIQHGEVALVRWGSIVVGLSLVGIAVAPAWWWSVPACFALGQGFYMMHNVFQIQATQMAPERRGAAVSAFSCCFFTGQAAGAALAGLAVHSVGTGWVLGVGALGVVGVGWFFNRRRAVFFVHP